ncbi:MAG: hypothetical protein HY700_07280 [Gemmatimonadetes bacterium]|nr:hypothetical protein [Gemmatimonadota bacterium]
MPRQSLNLPALMLVVSVLAPAGLAAQARINPDDLIGTWQLMTRKNLRTGVVDSIAKRRLMWEGYTRNTYHLYEMDLNPTPRREELRSLPPLERQKRFLEAAHFTARGGMFWMEGNVMHFKRVMSLDPNDIGTMPTSNIDSLTADYMYRHTNPDSTGVVMENIYRRVR